MTAEDFKKISQARLTGCDVVLNAKGEEYSRHGDRLHNFKSAGRHKGESPVRALWGMYVKHLVSVEDMLEDVEQGKYIDPSKIAEKIGDSINYHLLLEGLMVEHNETMR